jgi:sarcosine oxidase, subunit gamma
MPEVATRSLPQVLQQEWMSALPPAMRFILQGDVDARSAAAAVWGATFAEQSCRAILQGARATLWLGPNEYLLLGGIDGGQVATHESQAAEAAGALELALAEIPHALVNISNRQFALEVSGPHAPTILSGGCPLDLDLSEFPIGMCTRTVFAKADIVLWRTREDAFHIEVWRSFAGYVTGLLREIALEFYGT